MIIFETCLTCKLILAKSHAADRDKLRPVQNRTGPSAQDQEHLQQPHMQPNNHPPGADWLKKLRMTMGMPNLRAGMVVRGCSTLAPK